jgi:hypothetical protein
MRKINIDSTQEPCSNQGAALYRKLLVFFSSPTIFFALSQVGNIGMKAV